jgi:hypothetical protein
LKLRARRQQVIGGPQGAKAKVVGGPRSLRHRDRIGIGAEVSSAASKIMRAGL